MYIYVCMYVSRYPNAIHANVNEKDNLLFCSEEDDVA